MTKNTRTLLSLFLCVLIFSSLGTAAFAKLVTTEPPAAEASSEEPSIIDEAEISALVQELVTKYGNAGGLDPAQVSVGYTYLSTGDSWFLNPDTWYYSASMYKVPLMMILAEKEHNGEITQDTLIENVSLAEVEGYVLVNSNNDFAHASFRYISGKTDKRESEKATRPLYMAYSDLPENYYHSDFVNYSYFSARFMNDVMKTLYNDPNRFPHIIDLMKLAQTDGYFHKNLGPSYDIAQKYGSYKDQSGNNWNGCTGVIYTSNPFVLTVMTNNAPQAEQFMGELAEAMVNYSLRLDSRLTAHKEELARIEAERIAAEQAAEEAERQRLAAEEEAKARAEAERKAAEEARLKEIEKQQKAAERKVLLSRILRIVGIVGGIVVIGLVILAIFTSIRKRREKEALNAGMNFGDSEEDKAELDDEEIPISKSKNTFSFNFKKKREPLPGDEEEEEDEDEEESLPVEKPKNNPFSGFLKNTAKAVPRGKDAEEKDTDEDDESAFRKSEAHKPGRSGGYVPRH